MKKTILSLVVLSAVAVANAANVPSGLTGLWQFKSSTTTSSATVGADLLALSEGTFYTGPYTQIGTDGSPALYWDNGVVQTYTGGYIQVPDGIAPNGGGSYVNNYTVMIDYEQTSGPDQWNSLFQTAGSPTSNDGDLFIASDRTIGIGAVGYSTSTVSSGEWHRIVLSVDTSSFYRVYVDGTLFLDGALNDPDGRFSLGSSFYLFADDTGESQWGLNGTVAVWDHALTTPEVAGMGGWIGGASTPTALALAAPVPEPATLSFLALGALSFALFKRNRKQA